MRQLRQLRARFWIELAAGLLTGAMAVLTALLPDWIEVVLGVDPDAHSGLLEVAIVGAAALGFAALVAAGVEVRRARSMASWSQS